MATPDGLRAAGTTSTIRLRSCTRSFPTARRPAVAERTAILTANAGTPTRRRWSSSAAAGHHRHSLAVDRPDFHVDDTVEMDEVALLANGDAIYASDRGIPARMTVGYTSGQR